MRTLTFLIINKKYYLCTVEKIKADMAQLVERYVRNVQATSSNLVISTKRELSEHHYYSAVGSDSFFVAAKGIRALSIKSRADQTGLLGFLL